MTYRRWYFPPPPRPVKRVGKSYILSIGIQPISATQGILVSANVVSLDLRDLPQVMG